MKVAAYLTFAVLATICGVTPARAFDAPPVVKTRLALDALGEAAVLWQDQFACSGCHKQPITLAALATAAANGYEPPLASVVPALAAGMLGGTSGQDEDGCFSFGGSFGFTVATTFGGRGLEALDRRYGPLFRPELLAAGDCLLARQSVDGRLPSDHTELPAAQGDFLTTALGIFTWARSFEVTTSPPYQQARDQAVAWLRSRIGAIEFAPSSFTTQDQAMLLAGLAASGAGTADADVVRMRNVLAAGQLANGSWKLAAATAGGNAYATGQVVHALRVAGYDRTDPTVDLGTQWLLDNQQPNGRWLVQNWQGGNPSAVAPSMWAALALASFPSPLNTLRLAGGADAIVEWSPVEGADSYDLLRGSLERIELQPGGVDLGNVRCLAEATSSTGVSDLELPAPDHPFFYVMRVRWNGQADIYGRSSDGVDRVAAGGCPD